ncbi:MAG: ATP-binding protein [Bacilli bacterium]
MSSIFFQSISTLYLVLLMIVYFRKRKVKNIENSIYSKLIWSVLALVIFDFISTIVAYINIDNIYLPLFSKLYLVCLFIVIIILTKYTLVISLEKSKININEFYKKIKNFSSIIIVLGSIITLYLPINNFSENGIIYTYGYSPNFLYICSAICIVIMTIVILFKSLNTQNKFNYKKYLPVIIYIIFSLISAFIQYHFPDILLVTSIGIFITFILYFTIENPDLQLIEELSLAKNTAEKANIAKTDFLSNMSHEIRTPLNSIIGFSQALQERNLDAESKEDLEDIINSSQVLLGIVNDILDISKIEANKLEIVSFEYEANKIFNEVCTLVKSKVSSKQLEFNIFIDKSMPKYLYGDATRIKQILLNIITNSIKYTKKGKIDFKVDSIIRNDTCRLIMSIEDTGIGIKKQDIDKLFTKFQRFDRNINKSIEGTGLGLAITKVLVEQMNGKVIVHSVYGSGSKFTVVLDQKIINKEPKSISNKKYNFPSYELNLSNVKILVVDDNKLNLKVACKLLDKYKCSVEIIDSGYGLIEKIKNKETFDLVFLDDMMPNMSGIETLRRLKSIYNYNIPTIALTANAINGMKEKYLNEGFDDYLAKPIERKLLEDILVKFLVEGDYYG